MKFINSKLKVGPRMGCSASSRPNDKDLYLPSTLLKFSHRHLTALNSHFSDLLENGQGHIKEPDQGTTLVQIERLIQRLICGVGTLDSRFSSKYLINLEPYKLKNKPGNSLSYLVRIDELSAPELYPEDGAETEGSCQLVEAEGGPQGFGKVRITGQIAHRWAEFLSLHGYLRRDKVQERFVELLAQSAARSNLLTKANEVDESRLCGAAGKVVDPVTLHHILQTPPSQQVYLGSVDSHAITFPDPRDFRIAIVEGCSCIRLRVGQMYSNDIGVESDVEVTLVLGIGFTSWPGSAQFPTRISLCHIDSLLYYQAASTGFYMVPAPPHPTLRTEDRASLWQIRFPAAEACLMKHYSRNSVPHRVLSVLRAIVHEIRSSSGNGGHVISDYMLKTLLWSRLEEDQGSVIRAMQDWAHDSLAYHVLTLADRLVAALKTQRYPSYFFQWFNIMLNSPGGGTLHYTEEDYLHDAELITCYLRRLNDLSSPDLVQSAETESWRKMENTLIDKWGDVLSDLTPPQATRSRRLSFSPVDSAGYSSIAASQYSIRQLDYIGQILRLMLDVRSITLTKNEVPGLYEPNTLIDSNTPSSNCEDLIYLLSTILEQAKHYTLGIDTTVTFLKSNYRTSKSHSLKQKKNQIILDAYSISVNNLLEDVRNNKTNIDFTDDNIVVREVLKWLYFGLDRERKHLGTILRPYLTKLFCVSHESCWHISEWKRRQNRDELEALGKFCWLVAEGKLAASEGIIDAYHKGWSWAESMMKSCEEIGGMELILTPCQGKVIRRRVNLPKDVEIQAAYSTRSLGRHRPNSTPTGCKAFSHFATLPKQMKPLKDLKSRLNRAADTNDELIPKHNVLRNSSPMTLATESFHRYGNHRGCGSIVHALITLRKFTALQDATALLPEHERSQILDEIQKVSKETRRPRKMYQTLAIRRHPNQIYRSTDEFSKLETLENEKNANNIELTGTLMGTLRAVRRRRGDLGSLTSPGLFQCSSEPGLRMEAVSPLVGVGMSSALRLAAERDNATSMALERQMAYLRLSGRKPSKRNDIVTKL